MSLTRRRQKLLLLENFDRMPWVCMMRSACAQAGHVCVYVCIAQFQLDSQVRTGKASPPLKGVWHKCRLLNYLWVDTRPAKYLGAHTSLIGEYLETPGNPKKQRKRCGSNPTPPGT